MTFLVAYQQASTYTGAVDRKLMQAGLMQSARGGPSRPGVLPVYDDNSLKVFVSSGMNLQVYAGVAVVPTDYRVTNDATAYVTVANGDASARTDLVVLRVYETESGDGANSAAVEVVKGTSTAVPATPARSIALATIAVSANAVSLAAGNITDVRSFTSAIGGVLRVPSVSSPLAGVPGGTIVFDPDENTYYLVRNSGAVVPLGPVAAPYLNVGNIGAQALNAVYKFTTVLADTHGGWDSVNARYTVPYTGIYQVTVHSMCNGSGGYDEPAVQTATSPGGTYSTKMHGGNPTNAPWNTMTVTGVLQLNKGYGLRAYELGGAWTGNNAGGTGVNNYMHVAYLGST